MNPHIIKLIQKGHEEKIREKDYLAWLFNQYTLSAVLCAVDRCLNGNKAKTKYVENPVLKDFFGDNKNSTVDKQSDLTDEEKQNETEKLFMQLRIMGANFNLNHKGDQTL